MTRLFRIMDGAALAWSGAREYAWCLACLVYQGVRR